MARFLLAWELGGGLGHATPLAQLAQPLLAAGHEVQLVLRDLSVLGSAFGPLAAHPRLRAWQAPVWQLPLAGQPPPATYAELLLHAGYLDATRLQGLAQAWRTLLQALQPDLLVADHAPTALLAARGLPMRRLLAGTGFFVPPQRQPMPPFREWTPIAPHRVRAAEERALATCNQLLSSWGEPPLAALHELLAADARCLLTWPALDAYAAARDSEPTTHYLGPLPGRDQGALPDWPAGGFGRVLAYLRPEPAATEAALSVLQAGPWSTVACVPGLAASLKQRHASAHLQLADMPLNMARLAAQADAVLCHAGAGTVHAALLQGRPLVMLPMQAEQLLTARRVQAAGAGALLLEGEVAGQLPALLHAAVADGPMRQAAARFAQQAVAQPDAAQALAQRCIALASDL
ncbi:MAG: hypothetical protein IIZ92_05350 [Aquincola sp.]|nr:hypothetical protein [Aquincola sp.]